MDIKHFSYFVTIVECGCNLSAAATEIHISQSGLSKIILSFEREQNIHLFHRSNGRLSGLTTAGEIFYAAAVNISGCYHQMLKDILAETGQNRGQILIGIPPLVSSVVFSTIISNFNIQYPDIKLQIIEAGAEELARRFARKEIDFAVLLAPSNLDHIPSREHRIYFDKLAAFLSEDHELAEKEALSWTDLNNQPIAIFDDSFSINRLLTNKFQEKNVHPIIALTSASWDFLLESAVNSDSITILPMPIKKYVHDSSYVVIPFEDPIEWEVVLAEHTDKELTPIQKLFKDYAINSFVRISTPRH